VQITKEEVQKIVSEYFETISPKLKEERYQYPINQIFSDLREKLKWADQKELKEEVGKKIEQILGPKTEKDTKVKKVRNNLVDLTSSSEREKTRGTSSRGSKGSHTVSRSL